MDIFVEEANSTHPFDVIGEHFVGNASFQTQQSEKYHIPLFLWDVVTWKETTSLLLYIDIITILIIFMTHY